MKKKASKYSDNAPKSNLVLETDVSALTGIPGTILRERLISPEEAAAELEVRAAELHREYVAAAALLAKQKSKLARLLARGKIHGYGIGLRQKCGYFVSPLRYMLCVDVETKVALPTLARHRIKPIDAELKLNVEERRQLKVRQQSYRFTGATNPFIGIPTSGSGAVPSIADNPVSGGSPIISNKTTPGNYGTLGISVLVNGALHYLTCRHVAIDATAEIVNPPSKFGSSSAGDVIATVSRVSLGTDSAALLACNMRQANPGEIKGAPSAVSQFLNSEPKSRAPIGRPGIYYGAGSHSQVNVVNGALMDIRIGTDTFSSVIQFSVQGGGIVVGGDSGSALVYIRPADMGTGRLTVAGLVFASVDGHPDAGVAMPISRILDPTTGLGLNVAGMVPPGTL